MDSVFGAATVYIALLLLFRISGKRTVGDISTFDFVLLLIISESVQQAMVGRDQSMTHGLLLVTTLIGLDVALSLWRRRKGGLARWLESPPLVVVENGRPLAERMWKTRVDESDILAAARERQGLERMDQIKYAVVESSGKISIIPWERQ
ncbi:MAG: YetF domain-containing protein [Gemmatimonadaceae bacterium]